MMRNIRFYLAWWVLPRKEYAIVHRQSENSLILAPKEWDWLMDFLDSEPEPDPKLVELFRYKPIWDKEEN